VRIPPLRERAEDLPALIDHFLGIFAARHKRERKTVDKAALRRLQAYAWPGNVRQLEHVLLNAWLMSEATELASEDFQLPDRPTITTPPRAAHAHQSEGEFKDDERERILQALTACNWNRVQAAKMSGIPRRTFYRRLKEFGIL
jgi:DNA-binding NtrC family response regulator